ncbi:butyrophilin subfamily 2 member A1-like isoform X4 [Oncorhynchus tshawytscha]|uniref:butyrophilin subfamily 2 member A1-like isoform X4 n=1 Tax=Oncorhynchus tshawytscha TaxID=74940 RepID=UPI000D0A22C7|nr:butyrophilin subfamily 2 member A1-like isoform X4 [Oncorhynchus tshawytscha]
MDPPEGKDPFSPKSSFQLILIIIGTRLNLDHLHHTCHRRCIMGPLIQQVCLLTFLILFNACSSVADKQLVVPPDPVVTSAGHDVILPCHLSPQTSAVNMDIRWFKEGEFASPLYLYDGGKVTEGKGYEGRVSVFTQELEKGNISLLLNNVMASERGIYKCHASYMDWIQELPVVLQVKQQGSVPRISMRKHHRVFIQLSCSSENWYPEPDMLWTDSSGKEITSAETERPKQKEGGVLYSITSHMRIGMDQLEGVTCVVISQYQGTKMESKLQMTVAHPCCRPMPLTSGPGSRGCLFIMLVMCKVQTQEEFYMSSLPDRVYISAFMIPVFLGLLCITASVLSLIHQRRVVREKLKPLDDMNTKLKAMDQEVIKKTEELTYKDKLMGITETIPDSVGKHIGRDLHTETFQIFDIVRLDFPLQFKPWVFNGFQVRRLTLSCAWVHCLAERSTCGRVSAFWQRQPGFWLKCPGS